MGIVIAVILLIGIISLPLTLFKETSAMGIYVRANTPLISIMATERFFASFNGKVPSAFMASTAFIYSIISISEVFRRRGAPFIEWAVIAVGVAFFSSPDNKYIVYLIISFLTFIIAYSSSPKN
ncbi:hypothetical protein [Alloalcanivorax xenomutans]|uniref:Uncharacterized protein n=1 Tax=Alloalcanivorax xenomutans TaxID=1094342 RepID=A0A9Q3ZI88_9GAMM|nr:hypothetical protein [Alloalcanivorax xenomutans]MCE7510707.1 hypothetical protein [Alloalcanivorax xenomutans]